MKHVGIVGVTAPGAALAYQVVCAETARRVGGNAQPEITLHNAPFERILATQNAGDWAALRAILLDSIRKVHGAGADFAFIPSNSAHFGFDALAAQSPIPLLSILEECAEFCRQKGYRRVAVLGVGITMRLGLYDKSLESRGIAPVVPDAQEQADVNRIIYDELVCSIIRPESTARILDIIADLKADGCDAVILGCTELPLVVTQENSPLPIVDSTRIIALRAADVALSVE